jgi:hypothetical protein
VCLLSFAGKEVPTKYGRCAVESGAWKTAQTQGRALSSRESPLSVREYLERILCKQFSKFRKSWKPAAAVALGVGGEKDLKVTAFLLCKKKRKKKGPNSQSRSNGSSRRRRKLRRWETTTQQQ